MTGYSDPRILRIELPPGIPTLNANDRIHWGTRKDRTAALRAETCKEAQRQTFFPFSRVRIRCIFRAPSNHRRDVANLYPSFKAIIDGLVDAGVIREDHDGIVKEVSIIRGENLPRESLSRRGKGINRRDSFTYGQLVVQVIECE